jgi:hypothetical protein
MNISSKNYRDQVEPVQWILDIAFFLYLPLCLHDLATCYDDAPAYSLVD